MAGRLLPDRSLSEAMASLTITAYVGWPGSFFGAAGFLAGAAAVVDMAAGCAGSRLQAEESRGASKGVNRRCERQPLSAEIGSNRPQTLLATFPSLWGLGSHRMFRPPKLCILCLAASTQRHKTAAALPAPV